MASTRKRLEDLTADLRLPGDAPATSLMADAASDAVPTLPPATGAPPMETRFPPARGPSALPRTGPGQMLAFRGQMREVEGELTSLRDKLSRFEGAMPVRKLDPKAIHASRWANRHEASFTTPEFAGLKKDIETAGGNVQPILVRQRPDVPDQYELVFGHRRHRACLELGIPVLASIWEGALSDLELFAAMDRENRERANLSPYEQGHMYHRALEEGLFPSQRRLAEYLGVSHTWVRKALQLAQLPPAIVECFRSPIDITHRHADKITAALESDHRGVLKRAEKLRGQGGSANSIVERLLDAGLPALKEGRVELKFEGIRLGSATRAADGKVTLELTSSGLAKGERAQILRAVEEALQQLLPPTRQV